MQPHFIQVFLELAKRACDREEGQEVGLVARLEGWGEGGQPVLRLWDTVTNCLEDGIDLGEQLVEEGVARRPVSGQEAGLSLTPPMDLAPGRDLSREGGEQLVKGVEGSLGSDEKGGLPNQGS